MRSEADDTDAVVSRLAGLGVFAATTEPTYCLEYACGHRLASDYWSAGAEIVPLTVQSTSESPPGCTVVRLDQLVEIPQCEVGPLAFAREDVT